MGGGAVPAARVRAGERLSAGRWDLCRRMRLKEHSQDLGGADALEEGILDLLERGTGAHRQRVVYEANNDWKELLAEIVAASRA